MELGKCNVWTMSIDYASQAVIELLARLFGINVSSICSERSRLINRQRQNDPPSLSQCCLATQTRSLVDPTAGSALRRSETHDDVMRWLPANGWTSVFRLFVYKRPYVRPQASVYEPAISRIRNKSTFEYHGYHPKSRCFRCKTDCQAFSTTGNIVPY